MCLFQWFTVTVLAYSTVTVTRFTHQSLTKMSAEQGASALKKATRAAEAKEAGAAAGGVGVAATSRQHTSAYVSIRQHTSAYVSIRLPRHERVGSEALPNVLAISEVLLRVYLDDRGNTEGFV